MDSEQDVNFRLRLAEGFLQEAEEDLTLSRWRSCVDNAQLAVENAVKAEEAVQVARQALMLAREILQRSEA